MPFVYIVRCSDDTLYTGWAVNVEARIKTHNAGRGAKYTRARCPVKLVYSEELSTVAEAMKRERQIKRYPRVKKLQLAVKTTAIKSRKSKRRLIKEKPKPAHLIPRSRSQSTAYSKSKRFSKSLT
jgi:putative endonuclease